MIKEALEYLAELGKGISKTEAVSELSDRHYVTFINPDGELFTEEKPYPDRSHRVSTFDSFGAAVHRFGTSSTTSIWVDRTTICAVINDQSGQRSDRISLPLVPHHAFAILEKSNWRSQKNLIDLLRHDLADCSVSPDGLLAAIRSLKFSQKSEQSGDFTNTSVGLGKSLAAEVTGAVNLPETVIVDFHPYPGMSRELEIQVSVTCTLFTDPIENLLKLEPQPGELEDAWRTAMEAVSKKLIEIIDNDMPILIGTP